LQRQETFSSVSEKIKENFQNTQGLLYALTFNIIVTLMLFPGATADSYFNFILKLNLPNPESWYQLLVVFIFNVFDTIGRWAGGQEIFDLKIRTVKIGSYARVVFIATFLITDFALPPIWIWNADWFKVLNLVLFATTNGYLGTLCAVKAPGTVKQSRRVIVGAYIGTSIAIGVVIGCILQVCMTPILAMTPKQ
jgi:hypothetical protein